MASFGLKKFKRNGASSDKVRLKCFFGEEISVLTVPSDIKYRHLKAKVEEIFGEGVAIHKYEDHVGDLITVHSKHDVREAFSLYAKAIRKQSKRDAVEPYLKLHLAREPNPNPNNTGPGTATATPGTTPPSNAATTPGLGGSGGGEAMSTPVHRRQSSREKDREAREERGGGGSGLLGGYNRPISKSSPVLPSRMALSKSPPKSPPESPTSQQRRRSWSRHGPPLPRKEPASSSGGSSGGGSPAGKKRSSGKERSLEKKEKRRKKRISWKDAKGKLIEQRRGDDGDNHREGSEGEGEGGGEQQEGEEYAGGAALRRELSGSGGSNSSGGGGGRGRSFIRRLTPTNRKKIERTKSADDKDEVARSEVGDDIRKTDRDAGAGGSETETESTTDNDDVERLVSPQTTSGEMESHDDDDDDDDVRSVDGANGEGETFEGGERSLDGVYAALAEEASTESGSESSTEQSETEHGGEGEEEEGEAFDDDSEGEGEGNRRPRRKQQPTVYSPLVQHLPSGSPPVVPAHEPLSATKRMKLTIQTDMEELNWDVPAKALGSSRGRSNSDSSVINPPPATHTPPGMSPRSSFSEFSTQPLLTPAEYADYINAVPIHMRPSQPPALSSPDSHLPSFPGSPNPNVPLTPSGIGLPPILSPPDLASPTSHLPSVDLGSGHLTFTGTLPIAISAPPAVGGVVESPATLTRSTSPPPPIVLPAIVSSSAATDPPPLSSPTSHLPSSVFSDEYFPPLDEPLVDELTASAIEGLVPFRTPPKSSILRDVKDPLEEILDDEHPLGGGGTIITGQQPGGEQPHASEAVHDTVGDAAAALLAKSTKSDRVKRKGKKKRKLGGKAKKASSSGKITLAGYCEDWSKVNWQPGIKLGSGAFGVVYVGLRDDGAMFAVKQIVLRPDDDASAATSKEIEVMKDIHHDNIVQYLGTLVKDNILNIFMEYVPGGSLSSLVSFYGALKEQTIRRYTKQILHGLVYLHKSGIVHRDIKGANILVDPSGKVKLADFGCSKKFSNATVGTANYKSIVGTPWWMAPEVIKSTGYGRAADIWSLGCTIIEMATCHPPWSECTNMVATLFKISHTDQLPDIPASLSRHCKDFLAQCFIREPKQRPTAAQLLLHPFITLKGGSDDPADEPSSSGGSSGGGGGGGGAPSPKEDAGGKAWRMKKQIQSLASLITSTAGVFRLPKTLALHIFSFLPARDIDSLAQVCKYWSLLAMELWEQRCSRWPCKAMKSVKVRNSNRGKGPNWRRLYIEGDERERRVRSASVAVTTLKGHHKAVFAVQLLDSPNRIASGSEDKRLRFWEFAKGKWRLAHSAKAHTEGIYSLNFDSRNDNKLLMSGSVDKSIRIWDVTKYKNVRTITAAHEWGVTGLQYDSPNGILASSALDGTIKLWNVETGKNVATLRGHTRGVYCCACRDNLVVSGSVDETVRLWDKRDGSCIAVLKGHSDDVTSVQLDAQADNVVSGSGDATIRCWDIGTGECWNTWSEETAAAARSPQDGSNKHWVWGVDLTANHVFSASQDKTIKIWDFTTGACLRTLAGEEGHQGSVQALVAGQDRLISAGKDATVKVWQCEGILF